MQFIRPTEHWIDLRVLSAGIDFISSLVIVYGILASLIDVLNHRLQLNPDLARKKAAEGILLGLSLKSAATLVNAIHFHTWNQILTFLVIYSMRTFIKFTVQRQFYFLESS